MAALPPSPGSPDACHAHNLLVPLALHRGDVLPLQHLTGVARRRASRAGLRAGIHLRSFLESPEAKVSGQPEGSHQKEMKMMHSGRQHWQLFPTV